MNKNDLNNNQNNKWLVVSKKTCVDKIKDFLGNIFKIFKKEIKDKINADDTKETIAEEIKIPIMKQNGNAEVITQTKNQQEIPKEKKENDDNSYYKMIYNGMNSGKYTIDDLSPNEILTVMKMQKVEHEFTLKKLQQAMDNY